MLSDQDEALLLYRLQEAYTRLHACTPDHALLVHFRLHRDGTLGWNTDDGCLHMVGFHIQFSSIPDPFFNYQYALADAMDEPLAGKLERYIEALEDAVEW